MRAVCQRVSEARVTVDGAVTGEIGGGLVVLVGIHRDDGPSEARQLARKVAQLRIFEDDAGKFARSLVDTAGSALVVSQFTLVADSTHQGATTRNGLDSGVGPSAKAVRIQETKS
jgi:D-tyrosyl-tRNA(Tyr) deacylase